VPGLSEPLHQTPLETVGVDAIDVVPAEIVVVAPVLLQVIANDYESMCRRDNDVPCAAAAAKSAVRHSYYYVGGKSPRRHNLCAVCIAK
jgi:hypothetical protein